MLPINCFVIDFETTDKDPKVAHPIELAILPFDGRYISTYIKPPISIPPETSAIHHIIDEDVASAKGWDEIKPFFLELIFSVPGKPILVAHNAEYEKDVLKEIPEVDWICTYKCALRIWPDAPAHKNEVLRYWLGFPEIGRAFPQNAHNALHDCLVTQRILLEEIKFLCNKHGIMAANAIQMLIDWSKEPALLPRIPMGKHRGDTWDKVPEGYLRWMLQQVDMSKDLTWNARRELDRRMAALRPK